MKEYRIAVVAGDGIGPEVMAECKKVLTAAAELDGGFRFAFTDFPWGCQYYLKTGQMMRRTASRPCADMTPSCWAPWAIPEFRTTFLCVTC